MLYMVRCTGRLVLTHGVGLSVLIRIQQGCVRDAVTPPFTWPAAHDAPDQQNCRLDSSGNPKKAHQ